MHDEVPYRLTPMELTLGWVFGAGTVDWDAVERHASPREALEVVILEALQREPCGVSFSGGRDSSLILALAVDLARREGLPAPVPLSFVFDGADRSDESEWQELVVRHLGLGDWERLAFADELDAVGPYAAAVLRRHGVVWSPFLYVQTALFERLGGGSLLDGEGGDEVLGDTEHRIAPVARALRSPRTLDRRSVKRVIAALAPSPARRRLARRRTRSEVDPWLRQPAIEALFGAAELELTEEPMAFSSGVRAIATARSAQVLQQTRAVVARGHDVVALSPLLDPRVVDALARDGGLLGPGSRTDVIRAIGGELLPAALIERTTKAEFTQAYLSSHTRAFAEAWDGSGLPDDLVDPDALRAELLSDDPSSLVTLLLQTAWLAAQRHPG